MVGQICTPQLQCCAVRVTALNLNGSTVIGASSSYVTDSMVKITLKPNYQAGDEIKEKNACGTVYVDYLSPPSFVRDDLDLDFASDDPQLLSILVPQGGILSVGGAVGFAGPPIGVQSGQCGIELWTKRVSGGVVDPTFPYAHWLFPYVNNVQLGNREFSSTAGHTLLSGEAVENTNWFDGPANDWPAVGSNRSHQWIPTATLPTATCTFAAVAS